MKILVISNLFPSEMRGLPVLEAMACGLPVICFGRAVDSSKKQRTDGDLTCA